MTKVRLPAAPKGTKASGRALWRSVLDNFELEEHERSLLVQAVRVADACEDLQAVVDVEGSMVPGLGLTQRVHPALVELRQQRIVLARLIVALRVPLGDADGEGPARTQHRGVRGVHQLRSVG